MKLKALLVALLIPALLFAQPSVSRFLSIDRTMEAIPESSSKTTALVADYINAHFSSEPEKVRAVFIWVASNISYDVPNMFSWDPNETTEQKIARTMRTRKGICENYAAIFDDICGKCGITSHVVVGYSRQPDYTDVVRHAWCAARVNGSWQLFDPTWASGVVNNGRFVPQLNEQYYIAKPEFLLKTHMPYDPIWQMSGRPVSHTEFGDNKTVGSGTRYFSYPDSIARFLAMSDKQRLEAEERRLALNEGANKAVTDRLKNLRQNINVMEKRVAWQAEEKVVKVYNEAVDDFNKGVASFNRFIDHRNRQMRPAKAESEVRAMLEDADLYVSTAAEKLVTIRGASARIDSRMKPQEKSVAGLKKSIATQKKWMNGYYAGKRTSARSAAR
jgi:hypothetical protein